MVLVFFFPTTLESTGVASVADRDSDGFHERLPGAKRVPVCCSETVNLFPGTWRPRERAVQTKGKNTETCFGQEARGETCGLLLEASEQGERRASEPRGDTQPAVAVQTAMQKY